MSHNLKTGTAGENDAAKFLEKKGYEILEQNWRSSNQEIDLIALKGDTLVFIEVKTRNNLKHGLPEKAVTIKKQNHLLKAAGAYLENTEIHYKEWRFDVIAILKRNRKEIMHLKDAFQPHW